MTDLQKQFQEESGLPFDEIPINGVHIEYITWLEAKIQALRIHDVVGRSEQLNCCTCKHYDSNTADNKRLCKYCINYSNHKQFN